MKNIVITSCSLKTKHRQILNMRRTDQALCNVIKHYVNDLPKDVEVFKVMDNIAVTEKGYYLAFYEDELMLISKN